MVILGCLSNLWAMPGGSLTSFPFSCPLQLLGLCSWVKTGLFCLMRGCDGVPLYLLHSSSLETVARVGGTPGGIFWRERYWV